MVQFNDDARFLSAGGLSIRKRQFGTPSCNDTNHAMEKTNVSASPHLINDEYAMFDLPW
ncbi:hypothetical protein HanPI659440_Chr10g0374431 [Helianthus annuus]|nr:hypothetical protein HanPI659440_Chr10g0374431 [Helianthus annuus]